MSERRVCRVLGQHRSTQRRTPRGADDEAALTEDIIALARQYGRYGYRRVTALLRDAGWQVNRKRVERIWRREGLKVPHKKPKRSRLWLNDGSCIRLRPEYPGHVWSYDFVEGAPAMVASSASCLSSMKPAGSAWHCLSRDDFAARMCWRHWPSCSSPGGAGAHTVR